MKCPFCAETIQDEAIVCRFCGARLEGGAWQPPPAPATAPRAGRRPGELTMLLSSVFFLGSAAYELASITSAVPLFGALRGGAVAVLYHLTFVALLIAMGYGIHKRAPWGYWAILGGTAFYTLERLLYIADRGARVAEIEDALHAAERLVGSVQIPPSASEGVLQMGVLLTLVRLACWWGFAAYTHLHRTYFSIATR